MAPGDSSIESFLKVDVISVIPTPDSVQLTVELQALEYTENCLLTRLSRSLFVMNTVSVKVEPGIKSRWFLSCNRNFLLFKSDSKQFFRNH